MGSRGVLLVVALGGCGRVAFDPLDRAPNDARAGDAGLPPPGALVWLKMDSGPAGGIIDSAGGHPTACNGTCPTRGVSIHGDGYQFGSEEIDVNNIGTDLDVSTAFTGAVWLRLRSIPSSIGCAWSKPFNISSGFDSWTLCINSGGVTVFDAETQAGTPSSQMGPTIAPGAWHHMAITWDGTTKRSYFDGAQVGAVTVQLGHGAEPLTLGGEGGAFFLPADLDDALYYGRALTAAEIQQLATP